MGGLLFIPMLAVCSVGLYSLGHVLFILFRRSWKADRIALYVLVPVLLGSSYLIYEFVDGFETAFH